MKFSIEKEERYCVIRPGEHRLTGSLAPDLKTEFVILINEGYRNIICDLSVVEYCDSSGLSAFLVGDRLCNEKDGKFVITEMNTELIKLLKLSQLDSILNVVPTLKESIDFILLNELERDLR